MNTKLLRSQRIALVGALLLIALFALNLTALSAQVVAGTERIVFEPGSNTATVNSSVGGYNVNHYLLAAGSGQALDVEVTSPGNNVYLSVYSPSGVALARAQTGTKSYEATLTETGDFNLRISTTPGGATTNYTLTVTVSGTPLPTPVSPPVTTTRINFAAGATSATRTGRIDGTEIDTYLLNARAGQFMQTWVTSPTNDLFLTVVSPGGSPLARAQAGAKSFSGTLPENGDYRLSVSSPSGTAHSNYSLYVSVTGSTSGGNPPPNTTQRISFATGATSASVNGRIDGLEIDNYLLNARAGQRMQVAVTSPTAEAYLTVVSPGGSPLARAQAGAQSYDGILPENGDYRLSVSSPSGTAHTTYTLSVTVTGSTGGTPPGNTTQRITFAPGSTSASRSGQVDGGSTSTFLLNARAGQRMQVALASSAGNVFITVTSPGGATMASAALGETSLDRFLPENGDYSIVVSTTPGTTLTNFTLYVTII